MLYYRLCADLADSYSILKKKPRYWTNGPSNLTVTEYCYLEKINVNRYILGSFFLPRDQQRPRPARHTDYEGLAYLGEYPLAWAACCANESVYNLLLESGAHPDMRDSFGNMILHMVVVCDKLVQ